MAENKNKAKPKDLPEKPLVPTGPNKKSPKYRAKKKENNVSRKKCPMVVFNSKPSETTSAPPQKKSTKTTGENPSAPLLADSQARENRTKSRLIEIIKREDEKYEGINFDEPPPSWSLEDNNKMREVMRSLTIVHKKQYNMDRVQDIVEKMNMHMYGPMEVGLAIDIIQLLNKDIDMMNHMELKYVAFSPFSKHTYDWNKVAELLGNEYTPAQCKEYWYMDLYPRLKNMSFTEAIEKQLLELAIENRFQNWDKIADKLIGRNEYQCYMHFRRHMYKKLLQPKKKVVKST